jgi:hypothetical protein
MTNGRRYRYKLVSESGEVVAKFHFRATAIFSRRMLEKHWGEELKIKEIQCRTEKKSKNVNDLEKTAKALPVTS